MLSPLYSASIVSLPRASDDVVYVAVDVPLLFAVSVTVTSVVPFTRKVMVPVGATVPVAGVTVTVNVTDVPEPTVLPGEATMLIESLLTCCVSVAEAGE